MAVDNVPPNPSPPTSDHKVADLSKIENLRDALDAGSDSSSDCSLLLTEGNSAQLFAMCSRLPIQRTGFYAMQGKLMNVRGMKPDSPQLLGNVQIQDIKNILGLEFGREYKDVKDLRYGKLIIMCDQDHEGAHIKGLVINMFHWLWPCLLKVKGFLKVFATPIVTATHRINKRVEKFYTMTKYRDWEAPMGDRVEAEYVIKYYKGLGSIEEDVAGDYISDMEGNTKNLIWVDENDDLAINLCFDHDEDIISLRKNWLLPAQGEILKAQAELPPQAQAQLLLAHQGDTYLECEDIRYYNFIRVEYKEAALDYIQRNIPSMVDGMKRTQRKTLYCALIVAEKKETSLAELVGNVIGKTAYHQGGANIEGVITKMAHKFTGSNNLNFLKPCGLFGSRAKGGKDYAGPRYLSTQVNPITRYVFKKDDEGILNYLTECGIIIEPAWFLPVIPMVLVNRSLGIAMAWSSEILGYDPRDIILNLIRLMDDIEVLEMLPWYRGFKGNIWKSSKGCYTLEGRIDTEGDNLCLIKELPPRTWTDTYLETVFGKTLKKGTDYVDCTVGPGRNVDIKVEMTKEQMINAKATGLLEKFQLISKKTTNNMNVLDENGRLKTYSTPEAILRDFYTFRLPFYEKRRIFLLRELKKELLILENKMKFVSEIFAGTIKILGKVEDYKNSILEEKNFDTFQSIEQMADDEARKLSKENVLTGEIAKQEAVTKYGYLISLPFHMYTETDLETFSNETEAKTKAFEDLKATTSKDLWKKDLIALYEQLNALYEYDV